jgi:hypothetical protein
MAKGGRKPRQSGRKGRQYDEEFAWLVADVRDNVPGVWGREIGLLGFEAEAARLRQMWDDNRDDILARWAVEHPGRRPNGFWLYDAPDPHYDYLEEIAKAVMRRIKRTHDSPAPQPHESQAACLRRHGLLSPAEARRLSAADFEPELVEVDEHRNPI